MALAAHARVSEAEFLALPESNQLIELVDGEVIVAPSPTLRHQEVLARIIEALRSWAKTREPVPTVAQSPLDVRFGPNRILQPDALLFLEPLPLDVSMPIDRVPDLCVEVLSHNRAHDRVTKRYLFAEAGVQEFWIVDPAGSFERRIGAGLSMLEEPTREITTPLLPGFALDLDQLFAR